MVQARQHTVTVEDMTGPTKHKWTFLARFRAGVYGWKSSRLACQRLREAVSEIKKVAKKEPDLAAEGPSA